MRYCENEKRLFVSVREAVSTARRGISAYCPHDSDEPEFCDAALRSKFTKAEEVNLELDFEAGGYSFRLYGNAAKADGECLYHIVRIPTLRDAKKKEVVKQARGEAYMLATMYLERTGCENLSVNVLMVADDTQQTETLTESATRAKLKSFFNKCTAELSEAGEAEIERVTKRLPSMAAAKFPYGSVRSGQDEFIRSAYRAIAKGNVLFGTAPTGTGKTVSAIFPAIKALGKGKCEKIFYLTPKQTTAKAAQECIENLTKSGVFVRSVILVAKDKLCKRGHLCKLSHKLCETFKENNMKDAVRALFKADIPTVTPADVSKYAADFNVCSYELSLTYSELCDVIVCDFNYLFDPQVYIRRFFSQRGEYAFLIDEAHNLGERAREMYSAEITLYDLGATELLGEFSELKRSSLEACEIFRKVLIPLLRDETHTDKNGILHGAYHSRSLPSSFYSVFEKLVAVAEDELFANFSARDDEKNERISYIRDYLYKIKKFYSAICRFDDSFEFFAFIDGDELRAKLFCLDTGAVIRSRLELGRSAVIFSGTLSPIEYYRSVLGGDNSSVTLALDSPFANEQLAVSVMNTITTRYSEREDSLMAVCRVIAATLSSKRGNYMIFCPSFAYSKALYDAFVKKYPKIKTILQTPDMSAAQKDEFLAEFSKNDGKYLAAFCVLGGIYSEGIDLAGDKLIGAVIVGIGMPALSFEREAIASYYQEKLESGVEYAYLYPGMNRVLQAAGRVIRTENDRGVIVLIDDRFNDPIYKKIMPSLWRGMQFLSTPQELKERLDDFWLDVDSET